MKAFRTHVNDIYTEDMLGNRTLLCHTPNDASLQFVLHTLTYFHVDTPTLTWDEPVQALAPFTYKQIAALLEYQRSNLTHEYTCVRSSHGPLVPDRKGWSCESCQYTQDWALAIHTGVS